MVKQSKKIFCSNCEYYNCTVDYIPVCMAPSNLEKERDNWCQKGKYSYPKKSPGDINRGNQCGWFKQGFDE